MPTPVHWCHPCVQAGGGGEAEVCRRPATDWGRVHGHHLPGLHPDVCPQAERRGPGGGAGHRLCGSPAFIVSVKKSCSMLIFFKMSDGLLVGIRWSQIWRCRVDARGRLICDYCTVTAVLHPGNQRSEQHDSENATPVLHQRQIWRCRKWEVLRHDQPYWWISESHRNADMTHTQIRSPGAPVLITDLCFIFLSLTRRSVRCPTPRWGM